MLNDIGASYQIQETSIEGFLKKLKDIKSDIQNNREFDDRFKGEIIPVLEKSRNFAYTLKTIREKYKSLDEVDKYLNPDRLHELNQHDPIKEYKMLIKYCLWLLKTIVTLVSVFIV
ncbi:MAG: hypothetical protein QNJ47_12315 [Nostocaceae cyanobacterium]|nr:hypothetical protein [Nostocaceae cyanobacterium]